MKTIIIALLLVAAGIARGQNVYHFTSDPHIYLFL
jgi:hypothetical protein